MKTYKLQYLAVIVLYNCPSVLHEVRANVEESC